MAKILTSTPVSTIRIYTRYNPPSVPGLSFTLPSLTKQSELPNCNINSIMAKYINSNCDPRMLPLNPKQPLNTNNDLLDITTINPNYQDNLNIVLEAQETFASLPAAIRRALNDDPAQLFGYLDSLQQQQADKTPDKDVIPGDPAPIDKKTE